MAEVNLIRLETVKRGVNSNLFHPFLDPITLRVTMTFSGTVLTFPEVRRRVYFQIISFLDNQVKYHQSFEDSVHPTAAEFYKWIDLGTAHSLGLDWIPCELFGFRAAVNLAVYPESDGPQPTDYFDVSPIHWFRFVPASTL